MPKPDRWNDSVTCKFVNIYKKHECLWDLTSPYYKNRRMRDVAHQAIVDEMGIKGFAKTEVKSKIRCLRSTYYLELKKIQRQKDRKPTFKWFYIMQEIMTALRDLKKSQEWKPEPEQQSIDMDHDNMVIVEDGGAMNADETKSYCSDISQIKSEHFSDTEEITKTLHGHGEEKQKTKLNAINENIERLKETLTKNDEDECVVFGKYVGLQLKKMSVGPRVTCQLNIHKLISEALLSDITGGAGVINFASYKPTLSDIG